MANKKLKWSYDKKGKEWYTGESVPYSNDGWSIKKEKSNIPGDKKPYTLLANYRIVGRFTYLTSAKTVANLLHYGK